MDFVDRHVMRLGNPEINLRVESEDAAKSLRDIDGAKFKENHVRVVIQSPPPHDSASIGSPSPADQGKDQSVGLCRS